jgi:hypothetical protein
MIAQTPQYNPQGASNSLLISMSLLLDLAHSVYFPFLADRPAG